MSDRGGVTVSPPQRFPKSRDHPTPPRIAARCSPTLPLQGRVKNLRISDSIFKQPNVRIPAARIRARALRQPRPSSMRGRRECRVHAAPIASFAKTKRQTSVVTTGWPKHSGTPCTMVLQLIARSPRSTGLASLRRLRIHPAARLIPASGDQDHTPSPSASAHIVCAPPRPSHPALDVRDDRDAPSCEYGTNTLKHDF